MDGGDHVPPPKALCGVLILPVTVQSGGLFPVSDKTSSIVFHFQLSYRLTHLYRKCRNSP